MKLKILDLKIEKEKKKQTNPSESPKLGLIFQTYNPRNPKPMLNLEAQSPINLMLNDETKKKYKFKKFVKVTKK
jgi:hypothetical protein